MSPSQPPAAWKLWTALSVVYLVWGSTYLAIKVSVRTLPPLLSAGLRFVAAGLVLAVVLAALRRTLRVPWREAAAAGGLGVVLLACGIGVVTLAETRIDSSVAAMIAGSVPLQIVVLRTLARERVATATRTAALTGLVGLALIVVPGGMDDGSTAVGLALMLGASVAWSTGSFASRRLSLPADPFVSTSLQMLAGGVVLVAAALAAGEWREVDRAALAPGPAAAWLYLVVAGSVVGFSAYAWLLRNAPISQVVTHQYVNPLVAIALGAALLGERLDSTTLAGAAVVVAAVFATVRRETGEQRRARPAPPAPTPAPAGACAPGTRAGRSA